jgi:ABC-type Fe3+ transport system substrate-binding protein
MRNTGLGTVGSAMLAGCLGSQGGGGQSSPTPTADPAADLPPRDDPDYAEEWRKVASREAEKELQGVDKLIIAGLPGRDASPAFHDITINQDFASISDVYAPLTDNIEIINASTTDHYTRYRREIASGRGTTTSDVLQFDLAALQDAGYPVGDLSDIPGYIQNPDSVKNPPLEIGFELQGAGPAYNTEEVPEPRDYDHLLTDDFAGSDIIANINPPNVALIGLIELKGWDYIEQLGEKEIRLNDSSFAGINLVAQGEVGLQLLGLTNLGLRMRDEGAPVGLASNPNIWIWQTNNMGNSARPPHPWAAKLFTDYRVRPDHAELQAIESGTISLDGEIANPPELRRLFNAENVFSASDATMPIDEMITMYGKLLGVAIGDG